MQVTTTLVSVQTFSGNNAKGAWTKTVFTDTSGTEFYTFKGPLASQAAALLNQPVTVDYKAGERNGYPDNMLEGVAPAAGTVTGLPLAPATSPPSTGRRRDPEETLQIMRQSALDRALTAFGIAGQDPIGSLELYELADEFIEYFVNGAKVAEPA